MRLTKALFVAAVVCGLFMFTVSLAFGWNHRLGIPEDDLSAAFLTSLVLTFAFALAGLLLTLEEK